MSNSLPPLRFSLNAVALAASLAFAIPGTANADGVQAAAGRVTQIIAHRGASVERPECTLASIRRAIEVGATAAEIDVRTSRDGKLFLLHDATLDRTTDGTGPADQLALAELQQLDAGSWFGEDYRGERIPSLAEAAGASHGKIDLLLDLKEQGDDYDEKVAEVIRKHGDPDKTIVGVRSVAQAKHFRDLLPEARQLALIPSVESIEEFAGAGVETIRLWPSWLEEHGNEPVKRIRAAGKQLHLNGTRGEFGETLSLLAHEPDSLSSDDPGRLKQTLEQIGQGDWPAKRLEVLVEPSDDVELITSESRPGARSFLNRDYQMQEVPEALEGLARLSFHGGEGDRVRFRFRKPAVVFAAFDYNDTGSWSFEGGRSPGDFGWHPWRKDGYRGTSNPGKDDKPQRATVWFREFKAKQELSGLPSWWLCLGVTDLEAAREIEGFTAGLTSDIEAPERPWSHADAAAKKRPLAVPDFESVAAFEKWQARQRKRFIERMLYPYEGTFTITDGLESEHQDHRRHEFQVLFEGQPLFRFFRLEPITKAESPRPAVICFMGHGKVAQILDEADSYQHACAAEFVKAGYIAYAMENIGMEPGADTHHDLDQTLRLEGHGWYSLLFAHQRIVLEEVFADPAVDPMRVGTAGVSTGGLLALSAAVIEPRIAAASVQGIFGSMRVSFIRDRNRHCRCGAIPGLLPEFDLPELALLVAPRALHISNGRTDGFSPKEAKRCVDLITPLVQLSGGETPRFNVSPGGHEFAVGSALEFFGERLGTKD